MRLAMKTDRNGVPDRIFVVKYGGDETLDKVEELAAGPEVEQEIICPRTSRLY
jgi:hypothetical protein